MTVSLATVTVAECGPQLLALLSLHWPRYLQPRLQPVFSPAFVFIVLVLLSIVVHIPRRVRTPGQTLCSLDCLWICGTSDTNNRYRNNSNNTRSIFRWQNKLPIRARVCVSTSCLIE